jgi:hypothetical protein
MKSHAEKLRDALIATTPKTEDEARWVTYAKESKAKAFAISR